ncbi:21380_t:CDS:2, partial [Entrophospora sp. SA101]
KNVYIHVKIKNLSPIHEQTDIKDSLMDNINLWKRIKFPGLQKI